jgi:hypothetical protein
MQLGSPDHGSNPHRRRDIGTRDANSKPGFLAADQQMCLSGGPAPGHRRRRRRVIGRWLRTRVVAGRDTITERLLTLFKRAELEQITFANLLKPVRAKNKEDEARRNMG